jgi:pimeloyl-ACP methyl ester carboxylesterase
MKEYFTHNLLNFFVKLVPIDITLQTEEGIIISANVLSLKRDRVIVICHGYDQSKDSEEFIWLARELFKDYDVITFDFRGHGASNGWYGFGATELPDLTAVLNYTKRIYKNIGIIGFSLGAGVAIQAGVIHKDIISSLILVSAPARFDFFKINFFCRQAIKSGIRRLKILLKRFFSSKEVVMLRNY